MHAVGQQPCLFGLTIICTGYTRPAAKQELQQLLAALGAIPAFTYMPSVRADVLVAASVKSADYKVPQCADDLPRSALPSQQLIVAAL